MNDQNSTPSPSNEFREASHAWYQQMKKFDANQASQTESILGPELAIFEQGLAILRGILDAAVESPAPPENTSQRAHTAIVNRTFFALRSAWDEMLCARYISAVDHLRSLYESIDFIHAVTIDATAGKRWLDGQLGIERARAVIRNYIRDRGLYGTASDWDAGKRQTQKQLEMFSHVTTESCLSFLPVEEASPHVVTYRVRGEVSLQMARSQAVYLAALAVDIGRAATMAFRDQQQVTAVWRTIGYQFTVDAMRILNEEYIVLGLGTELFREPSREFEPNPATEVH